MSPTIFDSGLGAIQEMLQTPWQPTMAFPSQPLIELMTVPQSVVLVHPPLEVDGGFTGSILSGHLYLYI